MNTRAPLRSGIGWLAAAVGLATAAYATYVAVTWRRYGRPARALSVEDADLLLDRFMPVYEVRERHRIRVGAPAATTLAAAREMVLLGSPAVRAIIRAREIVLGAARDTRPRPRGLLAEAQALGWGVLADVPGREVVMGAVTEPWKANVVFRAVSPDQFAAFAEPGFVKIAWTLRADWIGPNESIFVTETRVVSTDAAARARFRRYWSVFSPGIILIRWLSLPPLKAEAERRVRAGLIAERATMSDDATQFSVMGSRRDDPLRSAATSPVISTAPMTTEDLTGRLHERIR